MGLRCARQNTWRKRGDAVSARGGRGGGLILRSRGPQDQQEWRAWRGRVCEESRRCWRPCNALDRLESLPCVGKRML